MKILVYIPLFFIGFIAGILYFSHMWKSIHTFGTDKSKVFLSMILRVPIPIIASFIGYFIAGLNGILSVLAGFTVFQIIFLIKKGKDLKNQVEKEFSNENNNQN